MSEKKGHQEGEQLESIEHVLSDSEKFIENNQKMITNIILGIIVVVLAFMAYSRYVVNPNEAKAQNELFAGELLFQKDSFELAINGDGNFMGFEYIIDKYGNTTSGNLAKYYAGISYSKLGDYDNAIKYLNKFEAGGEMFPSVKAGAIGDCYVELGELDKAISKFSEAIAFENAFLAPTYLKKCALVYESQGKYTKALNNYQDIKNNYPNSIEARDIDKYIARVNVLMQ